MSFDDSVKNEQSGDFVQPVNTDRKWGRQFFLAINQLINAAAGGYADETISARTYRMRNSSKFWNLAWRFIDLLFFWQVSHCEHAYHCEVLRKQYPSEYRSITLNTYYSKGDPNGNSN